MSRALVFVGSIILAGCVTTNEPLNVLSLSSPESPTLLASPTKSGAVVETPATTMIGLAFSGEGTRASAYSFGMLKQLAATPMPGNKDKSMLDSVRFVSGVSGGSVTAAWFGLKGEGGLESFREKYLIRDAEENLRENIVRPTNLLRAFTGGVNDRTGFGGWLDKNLFKGARYSSLLANPKVVTWINASDIYNNTPFVFEPQTFRALCSNLANLPISEAVAASAAVPVIPSAIIIDRYVRNHAYRLM